MAITVEFTTSFGIYDCIIQEDEQRIGLFYVTIKRRFSEPHQAYLIYSAEFHMKLDDNGIPKIVTTPKNPLPIYWDEVERNVALHILSNLATP